MKGQWFIITSALVIIVFFRLALLLKNYSVTEINPIYTKEDFYFRDLTYATKQASNFNEFKAFAEMEMGKRGFFVKIEPDAILISTNKMKIKGKW